MKLSLSFLKIVLNAYFSVYSVMKPRDLFKYKQDAKITFRGGRKKFWNVIGMFMG